MPESNEPCAYFTRVGHFDPEELMWGLTSPGDSWRRANLHLRTRIEGQFSQWPL